METIINYVENRCQLFHCDARIAGSPWDDVTVSNRRRSASGSQNRAAAGGPPGVRSRPFGGRVRGGRRSYAVLKRLHAMPRWAVPLATAVLVFVGLYAGPTIGGLCLLAVAGFLGWLAYLGWPQLSGGARVLRMLVLGVLGGVALARLSGLWG